MLDAKTLKNVIMKKLEKAGTSVNTWGPVSEAIVDTIKNTLEVNKDLLPHDHPELVVLINDVARMIAPEYHLDVSTIPIKDLTQIFSVDITNDKLLLYDASADINVKVSPEDLGIGGGIGQGVVETGSNSNGTYVKFDNGTMICTTPAAGLTSGNYGAAGTGRPQTYCGILTWTFPAAFIANPSVTHTLTFTTLNQDAGTGYTANLSTSVITIVSFASSAGPYNHSAIAIGRWK